VLLTKEPARMFVMQNIFMLRAIHFSIGHFSLSGFFVLKAASFPNAVYFRASDACNSNQRSTSILG
jgi:ABC-type transport system involved in cytochrome bd biosynthesis fused ATPase/permease subunit